MRYTLDFYSDDMGTFRQRGCLDIEDALWHLNRARDHDGLAPLSLIQLKATIARRRASMKREER